MPKAFSKLFDLTDRVAIVTGGSGGLGKAVASIYSDYGAKVVICGRRKDALDKAAVEIKARVGNEIDTMTCDASKEDSVKALVQGVTSKYGRIDILANFSGLNIPKPAEDYPLKDWEEMLGANATSVFLTCREVGKVMIKQNRGKIVNVSSVRSAYALPRNYVAYCANKSAVNMITKQLACEWAKFGILVNAVAPTIVETPLTAHLFTDAKYAENMKSRIPLGRWGVPDDVVGCSLFRASDASNFITGQIIFVDGGVTTWN